MKRGHLILIIGTAVVFLILFILYVLGGNQPVSVKPVTLEWWGVFDDATNYQEIVNQYKAQHPYVTISYKKYRMEEYEDKLIEAWARGSGPDIFALPNSWIHSFYENGFLTPMPAETRMAYYRISKPLGIKEELKVEFEDVPSLTITDLQKNYIDIINSDIVIEGQIYGLPQSMDTLALFYNKELLNFALITQPPTTWNEFLDAISKLTILEPSGTVIQSGAAIGTYENIPRAFDILSVLMMQNGTTMTNSKGDVVFNTPIAGTDDVPGEQALQFYTDFAQPTKQAYTWNSLMPDGLEAFINGQTAFFFGYQYHRDILLQRATQFKWSVTNLPQVDLNRPVNYGNYWVQSVAARSEHSNEAWNFIQFLSRSDVVGFYINRTDRTPVHVSLINEVLQNTDPLVNVFAQQAITAKSWYRGKSPVETEEEFGDMVDSVLNGSEIVSQALTSAAQRVDAVY